jgi:hypothetical protein
MRLLELLHVEAGRIAPPWSRVRPKVGGAPRLYVFSSCRELIRQLKSARVAEDGLEVGEAVDRKWEGEHGHPIASLRHGAMSRPSPSATPVDQEPDDPEEWARWQRRELLRRREERFEKPRPFDRDRYVTSPN